MGRCYSLVLSTCPQKKEIIWNINACIQIRISSMTQIINTIPCIRPLSPYVEGFTKEGCMLNIRHREYTSHRTIEKKGLIEHQACQLNPDFIRKVTQEVFMGFDGCNVCGTG
ncbi:hypothetical protein CDAR_204161 [Caerostris darwini]|uniref:Uncharacterized protein n=1 Tax=Caerostris darwini TaxID=1538125 RepID=A0AAV4QP08_9ARAC|nr:hypothetical protein CDAR_204161 [Caerostris darwini]